MKLATAAAMMLAAAVATPVRAGIASIDVTFASLFQQTSPMLDGSNETGAFFQARLWMDAPGDFASGTLIQSSFGWERPLTPPTPGSDHLSFLFPAGDAGNLFSEFAVESYTFLAGAESATLTVLPFIFPTALPAFDNFSSFASIDETQPFTVQLVSGFAPDADTTSAYTFLTITDLTTSAIAFDASFLSPDTVNFTIPADTLISGHSYLAEVIFRDLIEGVDDNADVPTTVYGEYRTRLNFSVGEPGVIPEPATWVAMLAGLGALGGILRARRRSTATVSSVSLRR